MVARRYNPVTYGYVILVVALGLGAAVHLLLTADTARWSPLTLAVFGGLSVVTSLQTITMQGHRPSKGVLSVSSASVYSLLLLVDPAATALVVVATTLADWIGNRRSVVPGLFNIGQGLTSVWLAAQFWGLLGPADGRLGLDPRSLLAGIVVVGLYALANHLLTATVLVLAMGLPPGKTGILGRITVFNEIVLLCFALSMAYLWLAWPPLVLLGLVPLYVLFRLLGTLHHREELLQARRDELASIQHLGLEIGMRLDVAELGPAVVRIASDALHSPGAFLALLSEDAEDLSVLSCRHPDGRFQPPPSLPCRGFRGEFFEREEALVLNDEGALKLPEVAYLGARSAIAVPLRSMGTPLGVLVVFDDGRRKPFGDDDARRLGDLGRFVEVALTNARLYADLKAVQGRLAQAEKLSALGQLISGVAHELNNPLTGVKGYAELLKSSGLDARGRRMIDRIEKEADRAVRIVRNLLTFARNHEPEKGLHDLNGILETVVEMRAYDCHVNDIHLTVEVDPALPRTMIDPHQLHQVLLNLVTNAEHAIKDTARSGHIHLSSRRIGSWIEAVVEDDGPGIPEESLARIFNPFFTTKEVGKGTGLGLSICYGIVREHGGTIEVESPRGGGARFVVRIPLVEHPAHGDAAGTAEEASPELKARDGETILVVDDEMSIRDIVREALETRGFHVEAAACGDEALARLRKGEVSLVITDLKMPGMDGQELFERVSQESPEIAERFVFSTGDVASTASKQFLSSCGRPVLPKPFSIQQLLEVVTAGLNGEDDDPPSASGLAK